MDLYQSLLAFSQKNIDHLSENYVWQINLEHLPIQLKLDEPNIYRKNIELRHKLHQAYLDAVTFDEKYKIIEWYIYHWGGVKANRNDTLREYTAIPVSKLISKGSKGIASWSKALSIIDPEHYAIYDARVAMSLNALQIIDRVKDAKYFPPLKGRNTLINFFQMKIQPTVNQWVKINDQTFYEYYLTMLKQVADALGGKTTHHDIEMLLFSHAEELSFLAAARIVICD